MEEDCKQESDKVDADKMDVDEGQVKENEEKEQDTAEEPTAGKGSKKNDNKRLDLPLLICVMVTITICFVFSIVFGIIASKYRLKDPNFVVNQSFVMNDNLSSHCPANWSMNFTIHNGNMHSSYSYKDFEVLAYYEGNGINDIFARAEIHPFSQGPENKTVIRVDFFSLVTMESYEFKAFSVEFRGKAYTHTNVANFVRRILLLDGEYIIKGKCEDLMFGGKENIATHSPKECYFCYESYSSGHKPCWY
nr:eukaryotic translation initiation factor 5B-like isoform X2 [Ipomoea trifida]